MTSTRAAFCIILVLIAGLGFAENSLGQDSIEQQQDAISTSKSWHRERDNVKYTLPLENVTVITELPLSKILFAEFFLKNSDYRVIYCDDTMRWLSTTSISIKCPNSNYYYIIRGVHANAENGWFDGVQDSGGVVTISHNNFGVLGSVRYTYLLIQSPRQITRLQIRADAR